MSDVAAIDSLVKKFEDLKAEIGNVIIGQEQSVNYVLLAIFCGGHSLLIGVPGLAKTLLVHTVSDALGLNFKRIQFTPDLMPSDILGSEILNKEREFTFLKGPIFSNIILADEISPDTCRLWDSITDKKLDKDRFRKDLGDLIPAYSEVAKRLGILHEQSNVSVVNVTKLSSVKKKSK